MYQANYTNAESEFIAFVNETVHDSTKVFYRYKKNYPIDQEALDEIDEMALVLFALSRNKAPANPAYAHLYKNWSEGGLEFAVTQFCHLINGIIQRKAFEKQDKPYYLLPNMMGRKGLFLEKLSEMPSEENEKITKISTQHLTVLRT